MQTRFQQRGSGLEDIFKNTVANILGRATLQEDRLSRPLYNGEHHVRMRSHTGKAYTNYNFLGPGTNLEERLERRDKPINQLDAAAEQHDKDYYSLAKLRSSGAISRKQQIDGVNKADSKFIEKAKRVKDRPNLGKVAASAIGLKKFAENINALDVKVFSGVEPEKKPADKLKQKIAKAIANNEDVIVADNDDEMTEKLGDKQKKMKQVGITESGQTGGNPILIGLAVSALSSLGSKLIEKLVDHFTNGEQKGGGSRKENIKYLIQNVDPQKLIDTVESLN